MENKETDIETPEQIAKEKITKVLRIAEDGNEGEVFLWSEAKHPEFFKGRLEKGENGSREIAEETKKLLDISEVQYHRDIMPNIGWEGGHHYMTFQPSKKHNNIYFAVESFGDYGRIYGTKFAIVVTESPRKYAVKFRRK